ncbi:cyanide hydratase [Aspergillus udagawae]|nr:cyanide hydratase [Aspergillus udagawae]
MTTPVRRTSRRPPVKVACLACRASRIRCDGQEKCANCISRERACCYVPSKRGGARIPRNKCKSKSRPSSPSTVQTVDEKGESRQVSTPSAEESWNSNNEDDILDHLMSLGRPGAGLRSVESSVAEMEHIFDRLFGVENGNPLLSESDESIAELLQTYGSDEDILDAYYVFIHLYYPILPSPERLPAYNRPLNEHSTFRPSSPLSLAISAILVLIPHPGIKQPWTPEYTRLRRNMAHSFAQSALEAVEADLELLDSSSEPSRALSDGAPMIARQPFHPKVPVPLEAVLALVLLSVYEYAQRGNIRKMCNRAGQALTAAMSMSLHEMVEDDEYAEARRRAWWITYLTVCQGSIASGMPAAFNLYDPRFVTPYPEGWRLLIEAQQTILEATTFVHDLDQTVKSRFKASWISSRMTELDHQIMALLLLCRRCSLSTTVSPLDSPEKIASRTINQIAEIKLHSARIKVHRFCAFSDVPIFRKRHCDLQPECCGAESEESAIPSPPEDIPLPSIMKTDLPDLTFPFSSHASSKICLQSALNIVTLVDNLPYPNPDHTIPLTLPPYLSDDSRVEIPRAMPTFACCIMQASYAMLMLYLKARAKHAKSPEDSVSAKGQSLRGFLNELQQNLRLVSKILANYAIAAEALQGMKEEVSHWAFLEG